MGQKIGLLIVVDLIAIVWNLLMISAIFTKI